MHVDLRLISTWGRDLLVAYAGGLVLGAPFAVLAVKITERDLAATLCLIVVMAALFVSLRRRLPPARTGWGAVAPVEPPNPCAVESRRVA